MLEEHLSRIFSALKAEQVRYLVVGGLAVVAHGHARFTADLDLVISFEAANVRGALAALQSLGYVPRAPVPAESLADPTMRELWGREKSMTVFQMFSDRQPETAVDIFIEEPFDFRREYEAAPRLELVEGMRVPVIRVEALLAMKRAAGRPQDLEDIRQLEHLRDSDADV